MSTPKILVRNLAKNFGSKQVLQDVSFEVKKGESLVILGGSGSGKSVCIKILSGLMKESSGIVEIDGKNVSTLSKKEYQNTLSKFGFLFQGGALFDSLQIWENVAFYLLNNSKIKKPEAQEIALKKLQMVGLGSDVMNLYPNELSGGMQKRVALARTITVNPEVIFFDEPTTGLDPIMSDVINDLIISNCKNLGTTTITITHDMNSAKRIADKVAMLYKGEIIWFGKVGDMYNSKNPYLDQFINGKSEGPIEFID